MDWRRIEATPSMHRQLEKYEPQLDCESLGSKELLESSWINAEKIKEMFPVELNGVADIMRYEILFNHGGFVVDADSYCIRALDDYLFEPSIFLSYENEIVRPGLIAAGYFYSEAKNQFILNLIKEIQQMPSVINQKAWITVGPLFITTMHKKYAYEDLTIYPSHYFLPTHYTGCKYTGTGQVYAKQFWGSTGGDRYDHLNKIDPSIEETIGTFSK